MKLQRIDQNEILDILDHKKKIENNYIYKNAILGIWKNYRKPTVIFD